MRESDNEFQYSTEEDDGRRYYPINDRNSSRVDLGNLKYMKRHPN